MKTMRAAALLAALLLATAAHAKDVCVHSAGGIDMKFRNVTTFHPGRVVALEGTAVEGTHVGPIDGTAVMTSNGAVQVGVFVHLMHTSFDNLTYEWNADATLAGSGVVDLTGDFVSDGFRTFTAMDCKTLVVP